MDGFRTNLVPRLPLDEASVGLAHHLNNTHSAFRSFVVRHWVGIPPRFKEISCKG